MNTTSVPFLDLKGLHQSLEEELVAAFRTALRSAAFIGGPEVEAFEKEFAVFCSADGAVGLASGTDALRLGLVALGLQPGDEVITVANTFIATSEAITQAGGKVKFVDVDDCTLTMDPAKLGDAITPHTVGLLPVHLYGQPADMDAITLVARQHGLWIVEDACQAHGAQHQGRPVGAHGVLAAYSFYPGKNLGALGDAGAVTGNDLLLLDRIRKLREHGQSRKYIHESEGYTARLDGIQAAFLRLKLRHLSEWVDQRRQVASWYRSALAGIPEVILPQEASYARHAYHLYVIRVSNRDELQSHLKSCGIGVGLHYPVPLHLQAAYSGLGYAVGSLPITEQAAETGLSLPMFPGMSQVQVEFVADAICQFFS